MRGSIAIDANLLLLLIVGLTSPSYIEKHKRLKNQYTTDDFDLLVLLISEYSPIILLPNTLTETSNLLRYIENPIKSEILQNLKLLMSHSTEMFISSVIAATRVEFLELGLTDAVLLEFISTKYQGFSPTLLTVDLKLAIKAEMLGYSVVNFNHYL